MQNAEFTQKIMDKEEDLKAEFQLKMNNFMDD